MDHNLRAVIAPTEDLGFMHHPHGGLQLFVPAIPSYPTAFSF